MVKPIDNFVDRIFGISKPQAPPVQTPAAAPTTTAAAPAAPAPPPPVQQPVGAPVGSPAGSILSTSGPSFLAAAAGSTPLQQDLGNKSLLGR